MTARTAVRRKALSVAEVYALPALPPLVPDGAAALGISRETAYALANSGDFPIPVIKIARSLKVRRADLLAFLGLENGDAAGGPSPAASVEHISESASQQIGTSSCPTR